MANVTLRTIRYYDKQDILKPSLVSESGARFYTDKDFARLQQILLLKYLGFSLEDIREMLIDDTSYICHTCKYTGRIITCFFHLNPLVTFRNTTVLSRNNSCS